MGCGKCDYWYAPEGKCTDETDWVNAKGQACCRYQIGAEQVVVKECIVQYCTNKTSAGRFVGDLCVPCHEFITQGKGIYSQAYRNALAIAAVDKAAGRVKK